MYMYMPLFNTGQGCFPPFSLVAGAWRRQIEVGPNHNLYLGQYPLLLEMLVELPVLQESLLPNPWGGSTPTIPPTEVMPSHVESFKRSLHEQEVLEEVSKIIPWLVRLTIGCTYVGWVLYLHYTYCINLFCIQDRYVQVHVRKCYYSKTALLSDLRQIAWPFLIQKRTIFASHTGLRCVVDW